MVHTADDGACGWQEAEAAMTDEQRAERRERAERTVEMLRAQGLI